MRTLLAVGSAVLLSSCGSLKKDVATICDITENKAVIEAPLPDKAARIADILKGKLSTEQGRTLFEELGKAPVEVKARMLRAAATQQGITKCGLAEVWDEAPAGEGPPQPPKP